MLNSLKLSRPILFFITVLMMISSCGERILKQKDTSKIDSLINVAYDKRDYQKVLSLADEGEEKKEISTIKASYLRGYAYSKMSKVKTSENYWKKAVSTEVRSRDDLKYYAMSANRLASLLLLRNEYEATMKVALPALHLMEEEGYDMNTDYANLLAFVASCQLKLGYAAEADGNYQRAYQKYLQVIDASGDIHDYTTAIIGIITITDNCLLSSYYEQALVWTERFDEMLNRYEQHAQAKDSFVDRQRARLNLYRGSALEGLGRHKEARKAYGEAMLTHYAQTPDGQIEAALYLVSARQWSEAADKFKYSDMQLSRYHIVLTLDNIRTYLLPKYRANFEAHRVDTALAVGKRICDALDTAFVWQKQSDAAELAIIYETQKKETQIARQQADMIRQRFLATIIITVLLIAFASVYFLLRYRASTRLKHAYNKLAETNEQLKIANARAEESSKMKTNFIQQISHEIRTPLNILSGFTQIVTTPGMELDDDTKRDINRQITENTDRITGLVNKMLELSDAGSRTVIERTDQVPAVQIACDAVEKSGVAQASHVAFDMQIAPEAESVMLLTNLSSATRALTLLLDNARKFTRPAEATGAVVSEEKQTVLLRLSVDGDKLVFTVEDTGIGIPAEEAEHIFEEFVQLNVYYDGTGIGLTVARSLARRLGGDVVLDTQYTGGARFIMTLPCEA